MNKSKVNQLYENAWQFMRAKNRAELYIEDQVYINLISVLFENVKNNPLFCEDIMISCTDRFLNDDFEKIGLIEIEEKILFKTLQKH